MVIFRQTQVIGQVEHGFAFIDDGYNFDITYGF